MIRRPPRSTQSRSSAASDVYKRQVRRLARRQIDQGIHFLVPCGTTGESPTPVSYTHLRAHETRHDLVCRLLLEKKKKTKKTQIQKYKSKIKKKNKKTIQKKK